MNKVNSVWVLLASMLLLASANSQTMSSGAMSAPVASSSAGNQDFYQGITFNSPGETRAYQYIESGGKQTIKNVPSVTGPNLTTSNDTCMGSSSGSLNGPGFGVSIGSTWSDTNCKLLKNSRELWNMGMKAAAMALMCTDAATRDALEITGYECPQSLRDRRIAQQASAVNPGTSGNQFDITDPYIRLRMGLDAPQAKN